MSPSPDASATVAVVPGPSAASILDAMVAIRSSAMGLAGSAASGVGVDAAAWGERREGGLGDRLAVRG